MQNVCRVENAAVILSPCEARPRGGCCERVSENAGTGTCRDAAATEGRGGPTGANAKAWRPEPSVPRPADERARNIFAAGRFQPP